MNIAEVSFSCGVCGIDEGVRADLLPTKPDNTITAKMPKGWKFVEAGAMREGDFVYKAFHCEDCIKSGRSDEEVKSINQAMKKR